VTGSTELVTPDGTAASAGNAFRIDVSWSQYIYDLNTDRYSTGPYLLRANLDDQTVHEVLADRLMLGTDWHTIVRNPKHEDFISRYEKLFNDAFGAAALPKLKGGNALRFLGLDKQGGKNRTRLLAFYAKHGIATPKWWMA
jgi:hypothetical protein